jgi:hypothetical protein
VCPDVVRGRCDPDRRRRSRRNLAQRSVILSRPRTKSSASS